MIDRCLTHNPRFRLKTPEKTIFFNSLTPIYLFDCCLTGTANGQANTKMIGPSLLKSTCKASTKVKTAIKALTHQGN